jgi:hypothetical protein
MKLAASFDELTLAHTFLQRTPDERRRNDCDRQNCGGNGPPSGHKKLLRAGC